MFLIIGSKRQKLEATQELKDLPLLCGDFQTEEKEHEKWLGQYISAQGLAASVDKTVEAREGKIKAAGREIAAIVEDSRSRAAGGLETALLLWQACCIPSLLAGCATWVEMTKATEKRLNSIQNWFLRLILQVGPGAPLASLLWDTGLLDMGLLVWREKLLLILHVRSLDEDALARRTYEEQRANNWPGLAQEAELICQELQIESANTTWLDPKRYRKMVTEALHRLNEKRIKAQSENKPKCDRISQENYGKKSYLKETSISKTRLLFKTRFGMMNFAGNFSRDRKFAKTDWLCKCRESKEYESHLLDGRCKVYGTIRSKYGEMKTEDDLVNFFSEVLEERDRLEDEEEHPGDGGTITDIASGGHQLPHADLGASRLS